MRQSTVFRTKREMDLARTLPIRPLRGLDHNDLVLNQRKVSAGLLLTTHTPHLLLLATHNATPYG